MNGRLALILTVALYLLALATVPAFAADWKQSAKIASDLAVQSQGIRAAEKIIETLGALKNASVSDSDPEVQKLFSVTLTDTLRQLRNQKDFASADTLGRWATSVSESKFGQTSPITYVSYMAHNVYALGEQSKHVVKNSEARSKRIEHKVLAMAKVMTPSQKAQSRKLIHHMNTTMLYDANKTIKEAVQSVYQSKKARKGMPTHRSNYTPIPPNVRKHYSK